MSVRASAGIFTDRGALYSMSAMAQDAPFGNVITVNNPKISAWITAPWINGKPVLVERSEAIRSGLAVIGKLYRQHDFTSDQ